MAEAVRPAKKKKKSKKYPVERLAEEHGKVLEKEKDTGGFVKGKKTVLEETNDDFTPEEESRKITGKTEEQDVTRTKCEVDSPKALGDTSCGLDEAHLDLGNVSAQTGVELASEGVANLPERIPGNVQQSDVVSKPLVFSRLENIDSQEIQEQLGDGAVVPTTGKSAEVDVPGETNLVEVDDIQYGEGQLGTVKPKEDIEDPASIVQTGENIANVDAGFTEGQLTDNTVTQDSKDSEKENKNSNNADLVGDIKDNEGFEEPIETCEMPSQKADYSNVTVETEDNVGTELDKDADSLEQEPGIGIVQQNVEDSITEYIGVLGVQETQTISVDDNATQGVNEEPRESLTHLDPTCVDQVVLSTVASGGILQESHDSTVTSASDQGQSSAGIVDVSQDKNVYGHLHDLFGKQQVSTRMRETVDAFSEDDLKSFYYNSHLNHIEDYVDDFIKETLEPHRESEFYELLNTYQNTSKNLRNVESDIEILRKKCQEEKKTVWSTEVKTATVQGICKDQQRVSYTHSYEFAIFNNEQATKVRRTLESIKNTVHETFTLAKYSSQLARTHIASYVYELYAQSPVFCGISEDSPITGNDPSQVSHLVFGEIQHLRDCISALFIFMRRPTEDEEFYNDVNSWLQTLVALLLRVATLPDHIFLLNHVLRCPPGVTRKLAHFIQPLLLSNYPGTFSSDEHFWYSPLLHHFITMLATLLLPIKFRDKYLIKMKALLTPDGSEFQKTITWVLIDEDGEEDENPEESWALIPENDLVALFSQFSFDALFQQIIGTKRYDGTDAVNSEARGMSRDTATNVMRVFAFSTCLIQMLGKAFSLYNMRRYREFVKRLGRVIRTIVKHVTYYWSLYKNYYTNKYGDNETTFHFAFGSEYSLEKLQLEYDQFFIRASQQIFSAHKLGAWQFLIDMPFQSLSTKMMWAGYNFLHKGIEDQDVSVSMSDYVHLQSDHLDGTDATTLVECFKSMTEPQVVYLLTTFANMARARSLEDSDFIAAVVREIYEVSCIISEAPDFLPKTGKDLLGSICSSHPFAMSLLLERIEETLEKVREECVSLFQALPVEAWRPKLRDIQTIRNWLLRSAVDSHEHQLARYLLTNLNWQYQDVDSDILYLPRCVHRAVAILLVETCALRLPNRPGGIAADVFKESPGVLEKVSQIATAPYQRIMQHYSDQDLYKWLWEVVMYLHLHDAEYPASVMGFTDSPQSTSDDQGITSSYDQSEFFKTLSKPEPLDLDTDEMLVNVLTSANEDGPLACYTALQLSSYGHDPRLLAHEGLSYISIILQEGHVFSTCRIIANVIPTFFTTDLLGLSENSRFTRIIDTIIHSDVSWRDQNVLEIMSGIVQKHVQKSGVLPGTNRTVIAVEFWLRTLCYLPNWNKDTKVLHLLDNLMKYTFRNSDTHEIVLEYLLKTHEDTLKSLKEQGFLSSLLSFITSNPSQANLVDVKTMSSYTYYCYYILCAESVYQEQCGLKFGLANKLHDKPDMCVETALKKVTSSMKDIVPIPSCNLDIYRWADLALSLDHDHPILAVVWQKFFYQFLRRVPAGPGVQERGSVGLRYFESTANTTYLKRLKARLMGTVEQHKALSISRSQTQEDDGNYRTPPELHGRLAKLFQTLALWLDEPRIHDPTLYLQGLPPVYDSQRLTRILKSDKDLWLDCVDIGRIDWELNASLQSWTKFNSERQRKISNIHNRHLMKKIGRMTRQLASVDDYVPPPSFKVLSAPLPEFPISVLLDKQKIMGTLGNNLQLLAEHARKFSMKFSTNSALDFEYIDMLGHVFENRETQIRVSIPCQKRSSSKTVCRGAANVVLKFREKRSNDSAQQRATLNRQEYKGLIHEMLHEMPSDICVNALCVEKSLTLLLKQCKSCQNPGLVSKFESIGSSIFHMFIDMVTDGVQRFPPTMQFFSACVELLGKAFIMDNKQQTEVLLRTILAHPNIVGLLLPIFKPGTCTDTFIEMYENVIHSSLDVEVKFSLLSKFDFKLWLGSKPTLSERISMMKVLFAALCDCGFDPPVKITMLSEIYMKKMSVLLLYYFPDLFGETLRLLVDGSADHALCILCWNEFLISTKILIEDKTNRELQLNTSPPYLVEQEQVSETITWLVEYYNDQRLSCSRSTTEGLFTLWKPYLTPLTALYEYVARQSIEARKEDLARNDVEETTFLWKRICDLFTPWLFPSEISGRLVLPWSEVEVVDASEFVDLFTRVLIYFQNFLPVPSFDKPNVLSLLWELYNSRLIQDTTPGFVLRVYHAKFTSLPWNVFHPTVAYLESMLQISTQNGNCNTFLGCIFPSVPWLQVIRSLRSHGEVDLLRRFQASFFNLLLVLGNEKAIIKSEGSEMVTLLKSAEKFDWDLLSANTYQTVCNWLVSNCNFVEILEPSSTIWSSLRLLEAASLLSDSIPSSHHYLEIEKKRLHYLNCMVRLLCKCSSSSQHSPALYRPVIEQLMARVLAATNSGEMINSQNITAQYMEILNLLNQLSPTEKVFDVALETIQEKLRDLTGRVMILAVLVGACRSLASISLMVQVVEVAVETHFTNIQPIADTVVKPAESFVSPWSDVLSTLSVPELSQREFVQECINRSAVLTLFGHVVQRLSLCQSVAEEQNMLKDLIAWTASIKPNNPDTETKVILLWYKIMQLIVRQVNYGGNLRDIGQQVDFLIPLIAHVGEDRDTSGLLGVIGLGKKSPLTVSFRFLCRALSTFLSAQLPSNGIPRVEKNSPGSVKDPAKKELSGGTAVHSTQRANSAFHHLEGLRLNKAYSSLVEHIEFSCKFIANPSHSLCDGTEFLKKLIKNLFKDKSYLDVVV